MSSPPREIGTLIVVVLKANHLPNKRHIGKQDPYCLAVVNGEKKRTKAIKRGGQHPEWDEELRFTLFEGDEDMAENASGTPPPLPPKDARLPKKIQGGNIMKVACYADDPREPDLIGETDVDLTEVLTKGETDDWFTLSNKDKFAGKVYLELTFWSNAPPPEKKATPKPPKANKQYAGPGSFIPSSESPSSIGASGAYPHSRPPSDVASVAVPSSLRPSNSLAQLDLYVPPYENSVATVVDLASKFSDMSIPYHRRESFPPYYHGYTQPTPNPYLGDHLPSHNHPTDSHDFPVQYQYDSNQPTPPVHSSRFSSIPVSSSGFMPLNTTSTFSPPTHACDSLAYSSTLSHIPYTPSIHYSLAIHQSPHTLDAVNYGIQPLPGHTQHQIANTPPTPALPQQYTTAQQGHVQNGPTTYSPHQLIPPPSNESISMSNSTSSISAATSRPLPPEPQVVYAPSLPEPIPPPPALPLPFPPPPPPPPPPLPSLQLRQVPPPPPPPPPPISQPPIYPINGGSPVPPPSSTISQAQVPRRLSLPIPPQQISYQPPPLPPHSTTGVDGCSPNSIPPPSLHLTTGVNRNPIPPPPPPPLHIERQFFRADPPPKPPVQPENENQWQINGLVQDLPPPNHA